MRDKNSVSLPVSGTQNSVLSKDGEANILAMSILCDEITDTFDKVSVSRKMNEAQIKELIVSLMKEFWSEPFELLLYYFESVKKGRISIDFHRFDFASIHEGIQRLAAQRCEKIELSAGGEMRETAPRTDNPYGVLDLVQLEKHIAHYRAEWKRLNVEWCDAVEAGRTTDAAELLRKKNFLAEYGKKLSASTSAAQMRSLVERIESEITPKPKENDTALFAERIIASEEKKERYRKALRKFYERFNKQEHEEQMRDLITLGTKLKNAANFAEIDKCCQAADACFILYNTNINDLLK